MLLCACIKNWVSLRISPKYTDIDTMPVYFVFVFLALELAGIGCALLEIGIIMQILQRCCYRLSNRHLPFFVLLLTGFRLRRLATLWTGEKWISLICRNMVYALYRYTVLRSYFHHVIQYVDQMGQGRNGKKSRLQKGNIGKILCEEISLPCF